MASFKKATSVPVNIVVSDSTVVVVNMIKSKIEYKRSPRSDKLLTDLLSRRQIVGYSPEWFSVRTRLLTASDVPSVLGQNKYCTARKVFRKKTRQFPSNFGVRLQEYRVDWLNLHELRK